MAINIRTCIIYMEMISELYTKPSLIEQKKSGRCLKNSSREININWIWDRNLIMMLPIHSYPPERIDNCGWIQRHVPEDDKIIILNHPKKNFHDNLDKTLILGNMANFISGVINIMIHVQNILTKLQHRGVTIFLCLR